MKIYLVAGESSGDTHATGLVRALREITSTHSVNLEVRGAGGPLLASETGGATLDWIEKAGVVGLWEVLKMYGWFRQHLHRMKDEILAWDPEVVILVDYPGFNLRLAKALRNAGWKGKIVAYISPQVWAWKKGRIPQMAKMLDAVLCLFPFEPEIYQPYHLEAIFTGHPMIDRLKALPKVEREPHLVGLFPGSRRHEVARLFPVMLEAAALLLEKDPHLRFASAAASPLIQHSMELHLGKAAPEVQKRFEISLGGSQELMQRAWAAWIASGTATLEATCLSLPYVLVYRVNPVTWEVGRRVVKIPFLGMANILAGKKVVQELLQSECTPESMAQNLVPLLSVKCDEKTEPRQQLIEDLKAVTERLKADSSLSAYQRAASHVFELCSQSSINAMK